MGLFEFFRKRGDQPYPRQDGRQFQGTAPPPEQSGSDQEEESLESFLRLAEQRQRAGPERPLIYAFEHHALRREVFENHPELVADLAGDRGDRRFWHAIANAEILCEQNGFVGQTPADESDPFAGPYAAERELLGQVSVRPYKRGGYTVYLVTMPEPKFSPEAHFVAIVHRDDESHEYMSPSPSTHYVTLEKTREFPQPLLCEWDAHGSHLNSGRTLAPDPDSFANWVFGRVLK